MCCYCACGGCGCRGHGQCCDCLVCFVTVMCPSWCAHVNVLLLNTTILWLSSIDHCGSQDPYDFADFLKLKNNYAKLSHESKKTSVRYRKISNPPQRPVDRVCVKASPAEGPSRMSITTKAKNNIVRVFVKASPAEGRRRLHSTAYAHLWGFSRPFY